MIYFYISIITYLCYCIIKYRESLYYLAKDKYDNKKYIKRIIKDYKTIFVTPELLSLGLILLSLFNNIKVLEICMLITYTVLFLYKLKTNNKKIKKEKRLIIRSIIILIIYLLLNSWFYIDNKFNYDNNISSLYYIILIIITYLSYFVVYIANIITKPLDKLLK